ncbi:MAG TPA: response regulator [Geminicoccaceae bacterium]
MPPEPLVCLVDDDAAVLDSLAVLLEAEGFEVRTFTGGPELLNGLPERAACIVSDLRMPGMDGLELLQRLTPRPLHPPVVMITGHGDVPMAVRAMQLGATDFIEKPFDPAQLVRSIRRSIELRRGIDGGSAPDTRLASLTGREREVFEQLLTGRSNKQIARALDISPRTVEIHRARVMEKMAAGSLAELVRRGLALGVDPSPT